MDHPKTTELNDTDDDIDCSSERQEFLEGKQIDEKIRRKALSLCRAFVAGLWLDVEDKDIQFRTVGGGFSNNMFYCSLPDRLKLKAGRGAELLIRIYGAWHQLVAAHDVVIAQLLSDLKLGPKVFGVFPGGRLEEFIPSKTLTNADLRHPLYSRAIARKLATIHNIEAPLNKDDNWAFDKMKWFLAMGRKTVKIEEVSEAQKEIANQLLSFNFESEIVWLEEAVKKVYSPVVFCHNDLLGANILVRDDILKEIKTNLKHFNDTIAIDKLLVFIDFEFCSYNTRGFELGNHFSEWSIDYTLDRYPNFTWIKSDYPTEDEQRRFIRAYLEKWKEVSDGSTSEFDTEEHLMQEAAVYRLVANIVWTIGAMAWSQTHSTKLGLWEFSKCRFLLYKLQKEEALKSGLLK